MRIYDLHQGFDEFIKSGDYQIEIIGEDGCWTVKVSRRIWDKLQRYNYNELGSSSCLSILDVYDFVQTITSNKYEN